VGKPEENRPLRRPRFRWRNIVKMDLQERGGDGMKLIILAKNMDKWGNFVNTAIKIPFP
jgi:hypothetical protein